MTQSTPSYETDIFEYSLQLTPSAIQYLQTVVPEHKFNIGKHYDTNYLVFGDENRLETHSRFGYNSVCTPIGETIIENMFEALSSTNGRHEIDILANMSRAERSRSIQRLRYIRTMEHKGVLIPRSYFASERRLTQEGDFRIERSSSCLDKLKIGLYGPRERPAYRFYFENGLFHVELKSEIVLAFRTVDEMISHLISLNK